MTLHEYLRVFRHRWLVLVATTLVAAGVIWFVTPANTDTTQKVGSYTATATLLVGEPAEEKGAGVSMGRIALYMTTGEIPRNAATALGYQGDPALLASGLTVTSDFQAMALTIAATASDGDRAAAVANAFADETVTFFDQPREGTGDVKVSILQLATPIPNASGNGFVVPPGRDIRTGLAAGLGLLLGMAIALILDRLDSRLRSRAEIDAAIGLPIVAEVPRVGRKQRARGLLGVSHSPLSPYADAYRSARTALVHTPVRQGPADAGGPVEALGTDVPRIVLVTSAHPAEGKTTSVANLAASFAETGQRVLVMDADLRSPDLHNVFDVPQGAGISDFLRDPVESSLETMIRPTGIADVRLITAGTQLAHPASLASRMGSLLTDVRSMADVIILDTAPLLAASDVFDLLPMVDSVLLIVRSGRVTAASGARVAELLGRFDVPVTGVVLVGVPRKRTAGYGYGYGYGYGESKRKGLRGRSWATAEPDASEGSEESETRRSRRATRARSK